MIYLITAIFALLGGSVLIAGYLVLTRKVDAGIFDLDAYRKG